ncbi:MAG: hypothetical protein HYU98_05110, partial [Deltaproteobacteria bacterium]|nr:hypothetical protein [Deltaproteobacteria bacterium]
GDKEYRAIFKFGERTDTDDAAGVLLSAKTVPADLGKKLDRILPKFAGSILQVPPQYSAICKLRLNIPQSESAAEEPINLREKGFW